MKIISFTLSSLLFLFIIISTSASVRAQTMLNDPDSILVGDRKLPEVFLVGTFHFAYYNLDAHVTSADQQVDILSPQKQAEMNDLLEYIYKFRPNKIAVESGPITEYLINKYRRYLNGEYTLGKDEREQIGFRLMQKFNIDTIYGVDVQPVVNEIYMIKDSLAIRPVLDSIFADYDFRSNDTISMLYKEYNEHDDLIATQMPLLDYFKYTNSDKVLNRGFGAYLNGDFKLGDFRGADALSMFWYNRNLRIFRRIQQITTSPDDRILVLYGSGHMQILKHLFECSPQYKLVKFGELE
jgi:hypothetical protein